MLTFFAAAAGFVLGTCFGIVVMRYRMASTLRAGWEVQLAEGDWIAIAEHWYITGPLRVVSMTLADGRKVSLAPRDQVVSRIPQGARS